MISLGEWLMLGFRKQDIGKPAERRRPEAPPAPPRDEGGRYVSAHRLAVRARCRAMLIAMGKEIPEVLK
jgi:hypothetical protein